MYMSCRYYNILDPLAAAGHAFLAAPEEVAIVLVDL